MVGKGCIMLLRIYLVNEGSDICHLFYSRRTLGIHQCNTVLAMQVVGREGNFPISIPMAASHPLYVFQQPSESLKVHFRYHMAITWYPINPFPTTCLNVRLL